MFTGIVEEIGSLKHRKDISSGSLFLISSKIILQGSKPGDSIMVDGACLTITEISRQDFSAFVSRVTLETTTLGEKKVASFFHLERAMMPQSRFGGHLMSGHIDGKGKVIKNQKEGEIHYLTFKIPEKTKAGDDFSLNIVEKGSIGIDGVSLTIAGVNEDSFWVTIIPETILRTNLAQKMAGEKVNLEFDMLGKYVQKSVQVILSSSQATVSMDKLKDLGY